MLDFIELENEITSLVQNENNTIANMANISALINLRMDNLNWVGFYLVDEEKNELVLGPFQGKPACIRIPFNKGVCGKCWAQGKPLNVPDVTTYPGHIACDSMSRSELVIPIYKKDQIIGVLDIDSSLYNRFSQFEEVALTKIINNLIW